MKIATITFHLGMNYGAVLQAFALQTQLEKLGHEPYLIDYQYGQPVPSGILSLWNKGPYETYRDLVRCLGARRFAAFRSRHLKVGLSRYVTARELSDTPPAADLYICGSDQIWNPRFMRSQEDERAFWLDFGGSEVRRIAYGTSFGRTRLDTETLSRYRRYARRIDGIGVRERDSLELMKMLGRDDAVWVPDPTLLLEPSDYDIISSASRKRRPYLFQYQLGADNAEAMNQVASIIANRTSLARKLIGCSFRDRLRHGPAEWLCRLRQASFVLTNSFHGSALSIMFNIPFLTVLRCGQYAEMNVRVTSLLEELGLAHRILSTPDAGTVADRCAEDIDWRQVNQRLDHLRKSGIDFLRSQMRVNE